MIKVENFEKDCLREYFAGFAPETSVYLEDVLSSVEEAKFLLVDILNNLQLLAYSNTLWSKGVYEAYGVLDDLGSELKEECNQYKEEKERREKAKEQLKGGDNI